MFSQKLVDISSYIFKPKLQRSSVMENIFICVGKQVGYTLF